MILTFILLVVLAVVSFSAGVLATKIKEPLVGTIILDIDRSLICSFENMTDHDKILTHKYVRFKMISKKGEPR